MCNSMPFLHSKCAEREWALMRAAGASQGFGGFAAMTAPAPPRSPPRPKPVPPPRPPLVVLSTMEEDLILDTELDALNKQNSLREAAAASKLGGPVVQKIVRKAIQLNAVPTMSNARWATRRAGHDEQQPQVCTSQYVRPKSFGTTVWCGQGCSASPGFTPS